VPTRVALEEGKIWVFASALDWPGWCRRGRGDEAALEALDAYRGRYALVAGPSFAPDVAFEVIGRVPGNATTDYGAPGTPGPWDAEELPAEEADRLVGLLEESWRYFDRVVASAPPTLRKGPRGGGRDRDGMVRHVREAERGYGSKGGWRLAPRTPWEEQRATISASLRSGTVETRWPARYTVQRCAWHVLDHAWEIEDKSE
jgi:hypothetical protein